jgi:hypothetical protein
MAVPRAYVEEHIRVLETHITGKLAELVFDLDDPRQPIGRIGKLRKLSHPPMFAEKTYTTQSHDATGTRRSSPVSLCLCGGRRSDPIAHHRLSDP